jgi:hypothetical protein
MLPEEEEGRDSVKYALTVCYFTPWFSKVTLAMGNENASWMNTG